MRCASQSTSRQRRPSSSDWRSPVIAAVRISDAEHRAEHVGRRGRGGPAAAAAHRRRLAVDDLVGDRADHRLELLERQELQVGLDVAAAPALGPRGAAGGVLRAQPRSMACSKTEWRKVMIVADRLRAQPALEQRGAHRLDVGGR